MKSNPATKEKKNLLNKGKATGIVELSGLFQDRWNASHERDISKELAEDCCKTLFELLDDLFDSMPSGDRITISNFGAFVKRTKPAGKGRNPKTGEEVFVQEKDVISFNRPRKK